jgi:glucose/arabinose dehydrogenase/PKD repeat protein
MRVAQRARYVVGVLVLVAATVVVAVEAVPTLAPAAPLAVPAGFHDYLVFQGLTKPTAVEFSPDGRIYVAEKRGIVKVFDNVDDTTATVVADLRTNTYNAYDRGMLGLALPPNFPADPSLYVLYTYDAVPGGTAPRWGTPGANDDNCPSPPGPLTNGCVVQGRLSRLPLTGAGGVWNGQEQVLLTGWCQQFTSHSIGHLEFAPDGALYVSGGDGAGFGPADWGQRGAPLNPCGDPPGGVGATLAPPTAEGGALRAQDLRTSGDPAGLSGAILRLDPSTGQAMAGNPGSGSSDPNVRRIVAYGFRNPFRFTLRPGSDELWIGEVGNTLWEEVDRSVGNDGTVDNFGWPCREGPARTPIYDAADLNICENLYAAGAGAVREPFFTYNHSADVLAGDGCDKAAGSAMTGIAIAPATSGFPDSYDGALFIADAIRGCIWSMRAGGSGTPDPATVAVFARPASATELEFGPDGALWYVDMYGGAIHRVGYSATNQPPTAVIAASATSGKPPLTVFFDGGGSNDPDAGDVLTYAWDLDNDGAFDDATARSAARTFSTAGAYDVRLRVRDVLGATGVATLTVVVGAAGGPVVTMTTPAVGTIAAVGASVAFSGRAVDASGRALPVSALSWDADLLHCPSACHHHPGIFSVAGVASGSLVVPDHEYPAAVELHLTATANGRSTTVTRRIDYRPTALTLTAGTSSGATIGGIPMSVNDATGSSPSTRTVATNGVVTVSAPATARVFFLGYRFVGWSDGGARTHDVTVPAQATTLTALYEPTGPVGGTPPGPPSTLPPRPR